MKKKRFWGILLLTLLLNMVGTKVFAHDIAVANDDGVTIYYYWTNNHTELEVSYRGSHYDDYSNEYTGNIVIPESVVYEGNTYPVTRIGFHAFQYCSGLASITIPNSVSSIGDDAFFGTAWYKNQPNGLVYAGNVAYRYKGTMPPKTHVEIKEGTLGISDFAFEGCSGLISISIPSSVTNIGENAFVSCSGLEKVIVKDIAAWCEISFCYGIYGHYSNPLSYAHHLYSDEDTEITDLIIPNNVTVVSNWAFDGCSSLTSVTIPNSVTTIGNDAFVLLFWS